MIPMIRRGPLALAIVSWLIFGATFNPSFALQASLRPLKTHVSPPTSNKWVAFGRRLINPGMNDGMNDSEPSDDDGDDNDSDGRSLRWLALGPQKLTPHRVGPSD